MAMPPPNVTGALHMVPLLELEVLASLTFCRVMPCLSPYRQVIERHSCVSDWRAGHYGSMGSHEWAADVVDSRCVH